MRRQRTEKINFAAVSRVVAEYMWDKGLHSEQDKDLPRKLKDRVRRAILGIDTTHQTLNYIMEAFYFTAEDKDTVWSAFSGASNKDRSSEGVCFTLRAPKPPMNRTQRHRTIALFKKYFINDQGALYAAETNHVITALEDGIDMYGHSPRDTVKDVKCIAGGKRVIFYDSVPGFVGMDIELIQPLKKDQTTSLQYVATYHPSVERCTEVRRAARAEVRNIDIRVCFDGLLPSQAWWCIWEDHVDGEPLRMEEVCINEAGELNHFIPYAEQSVFGFKWVW